MNSDIPREMQDLMAERTDGRGVSRDEPRSAQVVEIGGRDEVTGEPVVVRVHKPSATALRFILRLQEECDRSTSDGLFQWVGGFLAVMEWDKQQRAARNAGEPVSAPPRIGSREWEELVDVALAPIPAGAFFLAVEGVEAALRDLEKKNLLLMAERTERLSRTTEALLQLSRSGTGESSTTTPAGDADTPPKSC